MRNYQNSYVYGNLAYKLEENYELENRRKEKAEIKKANKGLLIYRFNLFVSILIVFIMLAGIMTGYSNISLKQSRLREIGSELKVTQDNLYDAKIEIAEAIDTKNIQKVATEKLGMIKAVDYQIITIDIPVENYTIKY